MKQVFSSSEVVHVWARQSQKYGRNQAGNIYFNGSEIFSYGSHFCMGKILSGNVVLLTNRSYSNTTHKHMHLVRYAVNHLRQIYVPYPEENIEGNAKAWIEQIETQLETIGNTRKKEFTRNQAKGNLSYIVESIENYLQATNQKLSKPWNNSDLKKRFKKYLTAAKNDQATAEISAKLYEHVKERQKEANERRKEETARKKKEQEESLQNWLNGGYYSYYHLRNLDKVYLRANEETVETSKGAKVSIKAAKVLFDLIQQGKDIKGHNIDGYTVIGLNGVLTIGCHKIERDEISRFAQSQNWV